MSGQVVHLPRRQRPGLGAYPYEAGMEPILNLSEKEMIERNELAASRGIIFGVLMSIVIMASMFGVFEMLRAILG